MKNLTSVPQRPSVIESHAPPMAKSCVCISFSIVTSISSIWLLSLLSQSLWNRVKANTVSISGIRQLRARRSRTSRKLLPRRRRLYRRSCELFLGLLEDRREPRAFRRQVRVRAGHVDGVGRVRERHLYLVEQQLLDRLVHRVAVVQLARYTLQRAPRVLQNRSFCIHEYVFRLRSKPIIRVVHERMLLCSYTVYWFTSKLKHRLDKFQNAVLIQ